MLDRSLPEIKASSAAPHFQGAQSRFWNEVGSDKTFLRWRLMLAESCLLLLIISLCVAREKKHVGALCCQFRGEERERETSRESREIVLGRCVSVCAHARVYADWNRRALLPRPFFVFLFLNFPIVLTKVEKSARLNCQLCASRLRTVGSRVYRRGEGNSNSKTLILKDSSVRSIWT